MYVPTLDDIKNALAVINSYKLITEYGTKMIDNVRHMHKRSFYDINEIFPDLIRGNISLNQNIECTGFLSRYSQTFLPMSYINSAPGPANEVVKHRTIMRGHIQERRELTFEWSSIQPPVSVIPAVSNAQLCFLYPENFQTFLHPVSTDEDKPERKNKILVPKEGKPFPVLLDKLQHQQFINKYVSIRGRLICLPNDLTKTLEQLYSMESILEYNTSFFNPYFEGGSFICLSLIGNEPSSTIEKLREEQPNAQAQIFTEMHLEGLEKVADSEIEQIVTNSIPNLASLGIKKMGVEGNDVVSYVTNGDISVTYKAPSIIGFYSKINLFDLNNYSENILKVQKYMKSLNRNLQNNSLEATGIRPKVKTDFVFDPTKAKFFDPRGVLNVDFTNMESTFNTEDVINWYRNAK